METNHKEILIERYLNDELSLSEKQAFEAEIQSNAELASEVSFQKLVINGIKKYRVSQLKSQLSAVDVSSGGLGNTGITMVTSFVVLASIVSGIYYFDMQAESDQKTEMAWINSDQFIAEQPLPLEFPVDRISAIEKVAEPKKSTKLTEQSASRMQKAIKKSDRKEKKSTIIAVVPQIHLGEEERLFDAVESEDSFTEISSNKQRAILNIALADGESKELKYKYAEGHLSLYGDFSASPYEILEINNTKGKQIYLYHLDVYYQIEPVMEITPLIPMSDAKKIEELKLVQKNN